LNPWVMEPKNCVSNAEKSFPLEVMLLVSCNNLVPFVRVRTRQRRLSEGTQCCRVRTCLDMLKRHVSNSRHRVKTPLKDTQMLCPRLAEDMIGHYAFEAFLSHFKC
jgi:hypothetical protein